MLEAGNPQQEIMGKIIEGNLPFLYVDGVGPANMSGDLLGKKSQLDVRAFDVGVPVVGRTVSP